MRGTLKIDEFIASDSANGEREFWIRDVTLSHISDFAYIFDRSGRFLYANKPLLDLWGLTLSEAVGKNFFDLNYPVDLATKLQEQIQTVIDSKKVLSDETPYTSPSGYPGYYEYIFTPVLAKDGTVEAVAGSTRDVTMRKRAEEALRLSEERYRILFDTLIEGFCLIEMVFAADGKPVDFRFLETNPAFERQSGLKEARGKLMRDLAPTHEAHWFEIYGKIALTGQPAQFESEAKALNRWYKVSAYRVGGQESRKVAVLFDDITARKRAEDVLRENRMRDDFIKEAARIGFWFCDLPFDVLNWDAIVKDHFWLPPDAHVTIDTFYQRLHPDDRDRTRQAIADSVANHTRYEIEYRTVSPTGQEKWIRAIGRTFYNPAGDPSRFDGLTLDVTEQKRAENALNEAHALLADKAKHLETLVQERTAKLRETIMELEAFSYSISHDMRSPLRAMQGYADALLKDHSAHLTAEATHYLQRIHHGAGRLELLVRDVLAYSRVARGDLQLKRINVEKLVAEIVQSYDHLAPSRIHVHLKPIPEVMGHEGLLAQIISNILGNAAKFAKAGVFPELTISSETVGNRIVVSFTDNGIGIAPKDHSEIFKIFGRVYPESQYEGTGIGLAIVKKACERLGGSVAVQSELGQGSCFSVTLTKAP